MGRSGSAETPPSPRYRIGDLSRLGGPAVSTLRAWQDRYPRLLRPARSAGGHRVYDADDLAAVGAVQRLVATGSTVAAAAALVVEARDRHESMPGIDLDVLLPAGPVDGVADPAPAGPRARTWWASSAAEEIDALHAAHDATRAFLRASTTADVAEAVARFVHDIGGTVRPAGDDGRTALPLDLSLGAGAPTLAHAPSGSPARRRLEALLPTLIEDARYASARLRVVAKRAGTTALKPGHPG